MSDQNVQVYMKLDLMTYMQPKVIKIDDQFRIRNFTNVEHDKHDWIDILIKCTEIPDLVEGERRFNELYSEGEEQLQERMLFIEDTNTKKPIATVTAWHRELDGKPMGYIHWLCVLPQFQKNGYATLLLSKALVMLSGEFDSVFLKTASTNFVAINLYIKFGFLPHINNAEDDILWANILENINSPTGVDNPGKEA